MLGDTPTADGSDEQNPILRRLAEALNVPPTAFSDPTACDLGQTTELLCLWQRIADRDVRAKVLAIVRTVASHA